MRSLFTAEFLEALDAWHGTVGAPSARNKGTVRLRVFNNGLVEDWLASAHPAFPGLWSLPLGGGLMYAAWTAGAGPLGLVGAFFAGALCWTLLEYLLHRFLFHRIPSDRLLDRVGQFLMHGYHHEFPDDPRRLVAPPLLVVPIAIPIALAWYAVAGAPWWMPLFAGTLGGYLAYDWMHWYQHHGIPTTALGKWLRRLHAIHHFKEPDWNHGISSPLWDFVFFTYTPKKRSHRAREDAAQVPTGRA